LDPDDFSIVAHTPPEYMYLVHKSRWIPEHSILQDHKVVEGSRIGCFYLYGDPEIGALINGIGRSVKSKKYSTDYQVASTKRRAA
jgi:hypothetical protein